MSKRKQTTRAERERPARPRLSRRALMVAVVMLAGGIGAVALLLGGRGPGGAGSPGATMAAQGAPAAIAPAAAPGFEVLKGRWVRPDGGYLLEIAAIDAAGAIAAAYLNPQPINIARAEASMSGATLSVFVELRAPNYPGSTYTLTYDPRNDQLAGVYFQAALQQRFDVVFVRIK